MDVDKEVQREVDRNDGAAPKAAKPKRKAKAKKPAKRKPATKKKQAPKTKAKKPAKRKPVKKVAKRSKAVKSKTKKPAKVSAGVVRTERLDLRLTKGEKAKLAAVAKAKRRTITSVVIELIEKLKK